MAIELKAPKGKFRVLGVHHPGGNTPWVIVDFDSESIAIKTANGKSCKTLKAHVYDDKGEHIHESR